MDQRNPIQHSATTSAEVRPHIPANSSTAEWSFSLRSYGRFHDSDDSDASDDENVQLNQPSDDTQLFRDLDLASRQETVEYKPNPWTIAKINASSRTTSSKNNVQSHTEPKAPLKKPQGPIVEAFKKQAERPPAKRPSANHMRNAPKPDAPVALLKDKSRVPPVVTQVQSRNLPRPPKAQNDLNSAHIVSSSSPFRFVPPGIQSMFRPRAGPAEHPPPSYISPAQPKSNSFFSPHCNNLSLPFSSPIQGYVSPHGKFGRKPSSLSSPARPTYEDSPFLPASQPSRGYDRERRERLSIHADEQGHPTTVHPNLHCNSIQAHIPETLQRSGNGNHVSYSMHGQIPPEHHGQHSRHHQQVSLDPSRRPCARPPTIPAWLALAVQGVLPTSPNHPYRRRVETKTPPHAHPSHPPKSVSAHEFQKSLSPPSAPTESRFVSPPRIATRSVNATTAFSRMVSAYAFGNDDDPDATWSTLPAKRKSGPATSNASTTLKKHKMLHSGQFRLPIPGASKGTSDAELSMRKVVGSTRRVVTYLPPPMSTSDGGGVQPSDDPTLVNVPKHTIMRESTSRGPNCHSMKSSAPGVIPVPVVQHRYENFDNRAHPSFKEPFEDAASCSSMGESAGTLVEDEYPMIAFNINDVTQRYPATRTLLRA